MVGVEALLSAARASFPRFIMDLVVRTIAVDVKKKFGESKKRSMVKGLNNIQIQYVLLGMIHLHREF